MILAESWLERNGTLSQIVATITVAVLTGLVAWQQGRRTKRSKTLDYHVLTDAPIVSGDARPDRLKITVGDVEVKSPFITQIRFMNTGTDPIDVTDFLESIEICRGEAQVVDWSIVFQSERDLVGDIGLAAESVDGDDRLDEHVFIKPNTMNAGDYFDVQVVYDGSRVCTPNITSRITRQSRKMQAYKPAEPLSVRDKFSIYLATFMVIFGSSLFAIELFTGPSEGRTFGRAQLLLIIAAVVFQAASIALVAWRRKFSNKASPRRAPAEGSAARSGDSCGHAA